MKTVFYKIAWFFLARSGEISVEQNADETLKRTTGEQDSGIEPDFMGHENSKKSVPWTESHPDIYVLMIS